VQSAPIADATRILESWERARGAVQWPFMQCVRHGLATGPDERCALCVRDERARERALTRRRDTARTVAIVVVALMAAIATFSLVGAWLDTR